MNLYKQKNHRGKCTCSECGRIFGGLEGFDDHRITTTGQPGYDPEYDWRCATDEELLAKGLRQSINGWWVRPMDQEALERLMKARSGKAASP